MAIYHLPIAEHYEMLRQCQIQHRADRREIAAQQFAEARDIATVAGFGLFQHSDSHYSLRAPGGWQINIYPGNRRLFHDRNRARAPFLPLRCDWDLISVVRSAIEVEQEFASLDT